MTMDMLSESKDKTPTNRLRQTARKFFQNSELFSNSNPGTPTSSATSSGSFTFSSQPKSLFSRYRRGIVILTTVAVCLLVVVPTLESVGLVIRPGFSSQSRLLEAEDSEDSEDDERAENYLYYQEDAKPYVTDYQRPPGIDEEDDRPDFLFCPTPASCGPRIVEFYAPWCPHCQHFRNHYVHFAKQLQTVAKEQGITEPIKVYAVSCTVHRPLCRAFDVHGYPKLYVLPSGATNATDSGAVEVNYWEVHVFDIFQKLNIQTEDLPLDQMKLPELSNVDTHKNKKKSSALSHQRTKQEVFDDAHLSLLFALKNGVYTSNEGPLANKTKDALMDWLQLLQVATPPTWQVQKLVRALIDDFQNATTLGEAYFENIVNQYPPPERTKSKWSKSCTKGKQGMGYTCGLWQLFHIITVGAVEWNLMLNTDDNFAMAQSVEEAAVTIRNFVDNFFGCEVCRLNFLNAFDACAHDRCNRLHRDSYGLDDWIQFPIWLFETHNSVNVRLLREEFEREHLGVPTSSQENEKRWPSRRECPACWENVDGAFSDMVVYKYLRLEYWYVIVVLFLFLRRVLLFTFNCSPLNLSSSYLQAGRHRVPRISSRTLPRGEEI